LIVEIAGVVVLAIVAIALAVGSRAGH
jgi:hypothetical protein